MQKLQKISANKIKLWSCRMQILLRLSNMEWSSVCRSLALQVIETSSNRLSPNDSSIQTPSHLEICSHTPTTSRGFAFYICTLLKYCFYLLFSSDGLSWCPFRLNNTFKLYNLTLIYQPYFIDLSDENVNLIAEG